jgi:hypothetical protein
MSYDTYLMGLVSQRLRVHGPQQFYVLHSALGNSIGFRQLDAVLRKMRQRGDSRTVRDKQRFGDGYSRWELALSGKQEPQP